MVLAPLFNSFYQKEARSSGQFPDTAQGLKKSGESPQSIWGVVQFFLAATEPKFHTYFLSHEYSVYKDFLKLSCLGTREWVSLTALSWFLGTASQGTTNDQKEGPGSSICPTNCLIILPQAERRGTSVLS